jgi:hypothetical protein
MGKWFLGYRKNLGVSLASLNEMDRIDWDRIECLAGSSARIPNLIRKFAQLPDRDQRIEVSSELWSLVCADGILYDAAPYVIRFVLELLDDSGRDDHASILYNLGWVCGEAGNAPLPHLFQRDFSAVAAETLRAAEEALPIYLWLFRERQDLRSLIALVLQWYPHRADEFVEPLLGEYRGSPDDFLKAELLGCLGRVSHAIPDWIEVLSGAASARSNTTLRYMASCQYVIACAGKTPAAIIEYLETTPPVDSHPRGYGRLMELPTVLTLLKASRSLPREMRISMLAAVLRMTRWTMGAYSLASQAIGSKRYPANLFEKWSFQ